MIAYVKKSQNNLQKRTPKPPKTNKQVQQVVSRNTNNEQKN